MAYGSGDDEVGGHHLAPIVATRPARANPNMTNTPQTIDEYLAPLSEDKRATLEKLRRAIKSAAPKAEECIAYQIPTFRLDGKMLVSFGAAAKHCAFYPGAYPVHTLRAELEAYDTNKGTIRFPVNKPLPATLVRKLVKARIAERFTSQTATPRRSS